MGSSNSEKKMKKNKRRRGAEAEEIGEIGTEARLSNSKEGQYQAADNDGDFAEMAAKKSKKARKNEDKSSLSSTVQKKAKNRVKGIESDVKNSEGRKGKSKKAPKKEVLDHLSPNVSKAAQEGGNVKEHVVYEISSGEDDCSKGMKKWIKAYHENRPGLKVLQQRIDDFIATHEEKQEQAKKEREAEFAEDGWTVVVHRKGGKRTTDPESGVAVGAVAAAAVRDKMAKKKSKDVGLDFYRFQRKEAQRSEIMKLQSAYEDDKKRIQQLRAARKFKPY